MPADRSSARSASSRTLVSWPATASPTRWARPSIGRSARSASAVGTVAKPYEVTVWTRDVVRTRGKMAARPARATAAPIRRTEIRTNRAMRASLSNLDVGQLLHDESAGDDPERSDDQHDPAA